MEIEAKFEKRGNHRVLTCLTIRSEDVNVVIQGHGISGPLLRSLPISRLEAQANLAPGSGPIGLIWNDEQPDRVAPTQREPLCRPDGTDPAGFSRRVAEAYREAVPVTHRPAALLAEEAGVPVTTVHRWIREARVRGFLPPGRRGQPG